MESSGFVSYFRYAPKPTRETMPKVENSPQVIKKKLAFEKNEIKD
jgi:hypothetical protein